MLSRVNPDYFLYREMSFLLNKPYNRGMFVDRQRHINAFKHGHLYPVNTKTLKKLYNKSRREFMNRQNTLYKSVTVRLCQQIFRMIENNFKDWIKSLSAYKKNPSLFTKRPKMPGYHKKNGFTTFIIDNQSFSFDKKHQVIKLHSLSKQACWWRKRVHDIQLNKHGHVTKINQITVVPRYCFMELMISYNEKVSGLCKDNGRYFGIDPGYDNLMVIGSNVANVQPLKISNGYFKRLSYLYHKKRARIQSQLKITNHKNNSARLNRLASEYHWRVYQFYHKACNKVIEYAVQNHISRIIIGVGSSNAQNGADMSKAVDQGYCDTPFSKLIKCLQYKAIDNGLDVIPTEESYTSQTSFLDKEAPVKQNGNQARKNKGAEHSVRRVLRGLFLSNHNWVINADLNGALQIIKKQRPLAFTKKTAKQLLKFAKMPKVINIFKQCKLDTGCI